MACAHNLIRDFIFWFSRKIGYPLIAPDILQVSLTYKCNLRCKMCNIMNLPQQEDELSTEQVFHIIDEAKANGIKQILFTGGEPFLRKDIFEICQYSSEKGLMNIVTTNGTLIDENLAEAIFTSGINHIHFSLDGTEESNDFFRGSGVFSKVIKAIQLLDNKRKNKRHFSIGIACTVMNKNVKDLFGVLHLADTLGVDSINFQPLIKDNTNFVNRGEPDFWLGNDEIRILEEEISRINCFKARHIIVSQEPRMELLIKYYQGGLTKRNWVCFGGFKTVFICFSKGSPLVYSCHGTCGNLDKISLKKSWTSKEAYKLRLHSKKCRDLCLQACYSKESAQSLVNLLKNN